MATNSNVPQTVVDSVILDAKLGLSADDIADKYWHEYRLSVKTIRRIARGHFMNDPLKSVHKRIKRRPRKRERNLLESLGMDYVILRMEKINE